MIRKLSVVLGIFALALLTACQGGQVELPDPSENDDDNPNPDPITDPVFGLAVGDSNQESPSEGQVNFNIPWTAVDANPNTASENNPLIYFAVLNQSGGVAVRDATRNPSLRGSRVQGTVELSLSSQEYDGFCGSSVGLFAAINPEANELPAGNGVGDGYQAIPEADIRLPEGMAQRYEETVDIVCEEDLTASFSGGAVDEGQTLGLDSTSTGSPEEYTWEAEQGRIRGSGQAVTYIAPQVDGEIVTTDSVRLTVARGQETATTTRDIVVRNPDYELPGPELPGPRR